MKIRTGIEKLGKGMTVAIVMIIITVVLSAVQFGASKKWVHY